MSFPMVGEATANARIARVELASEGGKDHLIVGCEFIVLDKVARTAIAQYLIQFSDAESPDSLRSQGLIPPSVSKGIDYYFIKSEEDYRSVLELRLLAHQEDGNLRSEKVDESQLADQTDAKSRIFVGKRNGEIIATSRVTFGEPDAPFHFESYFDWLADFPPREQVFEVGRTCTHPSYRRGDLFAEMIRHLVTTCVHADRKYCVIISLPNLLPFYEKMGFKSTGQTHSDDFWIGEQTLLLLNLHDICLGRGIGPLYWNFLFRDASEYLLRDGALQASGLDKARLRIYRWFKSLARVRFLVERFKTKRRQNT